MTSTTENNGSYWPTVAGLPREIKVRRETLDGVEIPEIQRIDTVLLREGWGAKATHRVLGQVAYLRRRQSDEHGSFSQYGWVPLGMANLNSFGLRAKRDAVKLLPKVIEFLRTYDGDDPK